MATNPTTLPENIGRITGASANYPRGSAKDDSTGTTGDGTPIKQGWMNDIYGPQQSLLRAAGLVPSGTADTALVSQYVQAMTQIAAGRATAYDCSGVADAYVLTVRANQQAPMALFDDMLLRFTAIAPNTGAVTVDVSSAKGEPEGTTILNVVDSSGAALTTGNVSGVVGLRYSSASNNFMLEGGALPALIEKNLTENTFTKSIANSVAFSNLVDAVSLDCDLYVSVDAEVYLFSSGAPVNNPITFVPGTDYAIYATATGLVISDNFTVPAGYTAANSRRVGGFHYGDGRIYPYSFWDLKFRPDCADPRGMVRSFRGFWADIYILNTTPDLLGTSSYGAQIADGLSIPLKPSVWGGDGVLSYPSFTQYIAGEVLAAYGKRLPTWQEFEVLALGSVTGYVKGQDPAVTQFDSQARSLIDCEQVSGHMWQFGAERGDRGDGASGYAFRSVDTNGEGNVFANGTEGVFASLFGGDWDDAGSAGSRASGWTVEPWVSREDVGARGVCGHFQTF